jgi:hypothetical protein
VPEPVTGVAAGRERELRQIGGGNTLDQIPGTPIPEINRNLK